MQQSWQRASLGLFRWLRAGSAHRCPFWFIWWRNRGPWFAWFNQLPSIFPKRTPTAVLLTKVLGRGARSPRAFGIRCATQTHARVWENGRVLRLRAWVRAFVRSCVRAFLCACVRACLRAGLRVCGCAGVRECGCAGERVSGCASARVRGCAGARVCGCGCVGVCVSVCVCLRLRFYLHAVCMYICMLPKIHTIYTCVCVYIYIYMCVCVGACVCVCACFGSRRP